MNPDRETASIGGLIDERDGNDGPEKTPPEGESPDRDSYAEGTPLTWVFGDHPEVKLVAAFLSEQDNLFNKKQAAKLSGVSRPEVPSYLEPMVDCGVIEECAQSGNVKLYTLGDSKAVDTLRKLEATLLSRAYEPDSDHPESSTISDSDAESSVDEPYAEDTPLTWVFGDHPEAKLVAALLSEPDHQFSITDWSTVAGLSRGPVYNHRDRLVDHGIVEDLGKQGRSHKYQLADNKITKLLRMLETQLLRSWYENQSR